MPTILIKDHSTGRTIGVPAPDILSLSGDKLLKALTPETVNSFLHDQIKVSLKAKVTAMAQQGRTDNQIRTATGRKYIPVVHKPTPEEYDRCIAMIKEMRKDGLSDKMIRKYQAHCDKTMLDNCFKALEIARQNS